MRKIHLLQVIFLAVMILSCIPLTVQVFGHMDPDIMTVSALFLGAGLLGTCVCAVVRAVRQDQEQKKK